MHDRRDAVFERLVQLVKITTFRILPDYVVNNMVAPGVDLLFGVPHVALGVVVLFDAETVVDCLWFR